MFPRTSVQFAVISPGTAGRFLRLGELVPECLSLPTGRGVIRCDLCYLQQFFLLHIHQIRCSLPGVIMESPLRLGVGSSELEEEEEEEE